MQQTKIATLLLIFPLLIASSAYSSKKQEIDILVKRTREQIEAINMMLDMLGTKEDRDVTVTIVAPVKVSLNLRENSAITTTAIAFDTASTGTQEINSVSIFWRRYQDDSWEMEFATPLDFYNILRTVKEINRYKKTIPQNDHKQQELLETPVSSLIEALNNRDTRRAAIEELGELRNKQAVEPLIDALKYEKTKEEVIEALGKIGDERAVEPLTAIIKDEEEYSDNKAAAVIALGKLGDNRAIIPLVNAFKTQYWKVRDEIKDALIKFGEPAAEPIIAALQINNFRNFTKDNDYDARCIVVETAIEINKNLSIEPLILLLKNEVAWDVQKCIAKALGNIGDKQAVTPLIEALISVNKAIAEHTRGSVEKDAAMDTIIEALEKITNQDFGMDPKKWEGWWKENKAKTKE